MKFKFRRLISLLLVILIFFTSIPFTGLLKTSGATFVSEYDYIKLVTINLTGGNSGGTPRYQFVLDRDDPSKSRVADGTLYEGLGVGHSSFLDNSGNHWNAIDSFPDCESPRYDSQFKVHVDNVGISIKVNIPHPTKPGHTFTGWSGYGNGRLEYRDGYCLLGVGSSDERNQDFDLYAEWSVNSYTQHVNEYTSPNDTEGSHTRVASNDHSKSYGSNFKPPYTIPSGYMIKRANFSTSASNTVDLTNGYTVTGEVWVDIVYVPIPIDYVTFDLNATLDGANANMSGIAIADVYINNSQVGWGVSDYYDTAIVKNSTYTVKNIRPSTGYSYNGNAEYSGTLDSTKSVVLPFTTSSYSIVYNGNGATSGNTPNSSHISGVSSNLSANGYLRYGYAFEGWSDSVDRANASLISTRPNLARNSKNFTDMSHYEHTNWSSTANSVKNIYSLGSIRNDYWTGNEPAIEVHVEHMDTGGAIGFMQYEATIPGEQYTISGYMAGHRSLKRIYAIDDNNATLFHNTYDNATGGPDLNNWDKLNITFTATTTTTKIFFQILEVNATYGGEDGYLWLKQWKLERGNEISAWSPSPQEAVIATNSQSVTSLASGGTTKTLYAVWRPLNYKVVYNIGYASSGTTGSTASTIHNYLEPRDLRANGVTKPGYDFLGWTTLNSYSAKVQYTNEQSVLNVGGRNLVPNSAPNASIVTGAAGVTTSWSIYNDGYPTSGKAGRFQYFSSGYGGNYFPMQNELTVGKQYTVGIWLKASKTCTLTVGLENVVIEQLSVTTSWKYFTLTGTANTNEYKAFVIYGTMNTGDIVHMSSLKVEEGAYASKWTNALEDNVNTEGTVNLYAVWRAQKVSTTVLFNGGTATDWGKTITYSDSLDYTDDAFCDGTTLYNLQKKNHIYKDYTVLSGDGSLFWDDSDWCMATGSQNSVLSLNWTKVRSDVTIDLNGGQMFSVSENKTLTGTTIYNSEIGDLGNQFQTPTRAGYTFLGWKDTNPVPTDFSTYIIDKTATHWSFVYPPEDKTIIAQWDIIKSEIKLDLNGGSIRDTSTGTLYSGLTSFKGGIGTTSNLFEKPTWDGHLFCYWEKVSGNTTNIFNNFYTNSWLSSFSLTYQTTDYHYKAIWVDATTTTLDFNGGSGFRWSDLTSPMSGIMQITDEVGSEITDIYGINKTDFKFGGWEPVSGDAEVMYISGDDYWVIIGGSVDSYLKAKWIPINSTYKVNHYRTGLDNTTYTLFETETLGGLTDSTVVAPIKPYTGFIPPTTKNITILADGSAVVNYYYTREIIPVTYIDKVDSEIGATLGSITTINSVYGATATGATRGSVTTANFYYTGYSYNYSTSIVVTTTGLTVYRIFTIGTFTLTYILNNGAVGTVNPTIFNVTTPTFTLNNPTKVGHVFEGWVGSNGVTPSKTVTISKGSTGNKTYEAIFTAEKYTVTFDANNGTISGGSFSSKQVDYASTYSTLATATRLGYTFNGWYDSITGGNRVYETTQVTKIVNHTLYAQWVPASVPYTVRHSKMNLDGTTYSLYQTEALTGLTGSTVTPTALNIAGFKTPVNKSTTISADGTTIVDYYYDRESYYLDLNTSFNGIGAINTFCTVDVLINGVVVNYNVADFYLSILYGSTYEFRFVSTSTGRQLVTSTSLLTGTLTGYTNITLDFTNIVYSIDYNYGSLVVANPTTYTIDTPTFTLINPIVSGYTFNGWSGSNGLTPQTTITITKGTTGNLTYTTNYSLIAYTISYNLNGGSVASNPTYYNVETTTFTLNNPIKLGYTFSGWSGSNGVTPNKIITITKGSIGNLSYVANYTPNPYKISYLSGIGSGTTSTVTDCTYDSNAILLPNMFTPPSHTIIFNTNGGGAVPNRVLTNTWKSWNIQGTSYGTSSITKPNFTSVKDAVVSATAEWNAISYTIAETSIKPAFNLEGWYYDVGLTNKVTGFNINTASSTITLYAKWVPTTTTLIVNPGIGGKWSQSGNSKGVGLTTNQSFVQNVNSTISLPIPYKRGYSFTGWVKTGNGVGSTIANSTVSNSTYTYGSVGDRVDTLTATYTANTYTVNFSTNKPSISSVAPIFTGTSQAYTYNTTSSLTLIKPLLYGWTFSSWGTTVNSAITSPTVQISQPSLPNQISTVQPLSLASGASISTLISYYGLEDTNNANLTLYAQYTQSSYTIKFNGNGSTSGIMTDMAMIYDSAPRTLTLNAFTRIDNNHSNVSNYTDYYKPIIDSKYTTNAIQHNSTYNTSYNYKFLCWVNGTAQDLSNSYVVPTQTSYTGVSGADGTFFKSFTNGATVKNLVPSGIVNLYAFWNGIPNLTTSSPTTHFNFYEGANITNANLLSKVVANDREDGDITNKIWVSEIIYADGTKFTDATGISKLTLDTTKESHVGTYTITYKVADLRNEVATQTYLGNIYYNTTPYFVQGDTRYFYRDNLLTMTDAEIMQLLKVGVLYNDVEDTLASTSTDALYTGRLTPVLEIVDLLTTINDMRSRSGAESNQPKNMTIKYRYWDSYRKSDAYMSTGYITVGDSTKINPSNEIELEIVIVDSATDIDNVVLTQQYVRSISSLFLDSLDADTLWQSGNRLNLLQSTFVKEESDYLFLDYKPN